MIYVRVIGNFIAGVCLSGLLPPFRYEKSTMYAYVSIVLQIEM